MASPCLLPKALHDATLGGIRSPGFFNLLQSGDKDGKIVHLCKAWFEQYDPIHDQVLDAQKEGSKNPGLLLVVTAMEKICRLFRSLAFLLGSSEVEGSAKDVMYFANYRGKDLFDKAIRDALMAPPPASDGNAAAPANPWTWTKLVDEVIKTAGSAAALQPLYDATMDELKKIKGKNADELAWTSDGLRTLVANAKKIQAGVRKSQTEQMEKAMLAPLLAWSGEIVKKEVSAETFACAEAGLEALTLLKARPGAMDRLEALKAWLAASASTVARLSLAALAKETNESRTFNLTQLNNILAKVEIGSCEDMTQTLLNFAADILNVTFGKAGCWMALPVGLGIGRIRHKLEPFCRQHFLLAARSRLQLQIIHILFNFIHFFSRWSLDLTH